MRPQTNLQAAWRAVCRINLAGISLWDYRFPPGDAPRRAVRARQGAAEGDRQGQRFVPQVLFAAYQSMGSGRAVQMTFDARGVVKPIDLWFHPA
jgi:hypothetical protein